MSSPEASVYFHLASLPTDKTQLCKKCFQASFPTHYLNHANSSAPDTPPLVISISKQKNEPMKGAQFGLNQA